jgi:hypothetical protein
MMAGSRIPGPIGTERNNPEIDTGTLMRHRADPPVPFDQHVVIAHPKRSVENLPEVTVHGRRVIVGFISKNVGYELTFRTNKPQEFRLKNLEIHDSDKFNFYTNMTATGVNPRSLGLFVERSKRLETYTGHPDVKKMKTLTFGMQKVIDLLNAALDQNETFRVGIVGNVAVYSKDGNFDYKNGYDFVDHDPKDFDGFVQGRADNVKIGYFGNRDNVDAYGVNSVPEADREHLDLSKPNEDFTGATIYLKGSPSPAIKSMPRFGD